MLRPKTPNIPFLFLPFLSLRRKSNYAAAASLPTVQDDGVDHYARCLSLLPDLVRRGLLSAARSVVERIVSRSSLPDSLSALHCAASLGLSLDFDRLLRPLVTSGQLLKAEALFTDGTAGIFSPFDSSVFSSMIICYCKLGNIGQAKTQLGRLIKIESLPSTAACTVLLHAFSVKDQFLEAHGLFLSMTNAGFFPSQSAYNLLIPGLCSAGHLEKAHHVFDVMIDSGIRPTIHLYRSLVYGLCKINRTFEAEQMVHEMESRDLFPDLRMYTAIMQRYCAEGRLKSALNIFNMMGKHKGCCRPDASVYSRLVHGFLNQGDFDTAGKLVKQMMDRGLLPDRLLSFVIVSLHCRIRKVDCAILFLDAMVNRGLTPDLRHYMVPIYALCKENRLEEADRWFDKMLDSGLIPDNASFVSLIKNHPRGQEPKIVRNILLAMEKKGLSIDPSVLSKPCSEETLNREAELMFDMIVENEVVPADVALNILVYALCIKKKVDLALLFLDKMAGHGCEISVFTYNSLLSCLCKEGQMDNPFFINLVQRWGVVCNLSSYLILIDMYCKCGDVDSAFRFYKHMIEIGSMPTVAIYDSIIGSLCRKKRLRDAECMFQLMFEEGVEPDEVVYTTLIIGYSKMGRTVDACNLFYKMVKEGLQPSLRAWRVYIDVLKKRNMFHKARQFLKVMAIKGYIPVR